MPRALLLYHSFTNQSVRVADVIDETLRARGFEVERAAIELTDQRWVKRFAEFPMKHPIINIARMAPAQLRRATGEIRVPDVVSQGTYDLVVIGSPTWWLTTSIPIRSFLTSDAAGSLLKGTPVAGYVVCRRYWNANLKTVRKLAEKHGGRWLDGVHFTFAGGQVRSLLSLVSFFGTGTDEKRYLGVKIPPSNLKADFDVEARAFATELADRLSPTAAAAA